MANNSNNKPNKPKGKWQETNESFVNPYSFMPVRGTVIRTDPEQGTLSGKIICTIKAVTPLAIPDHERKQISNDLSEHYIYPFFSKADGTHLISGSSVRGVVRSMFETITNSCFSVNNNNILSARHSFPRKWGLLKYDRDGWHLFPANMQKEKGLIKIGVKVKIQKDREVKIKKRKKLRKKLRMKLKIILIVMKY